MDIKDLEKIMVEHGLVLRAVPQTVRSVFEPQYIDKYPNGTIQYVHGRNMLVVEETPPNAGKFYFQRQRNTLTTVWFQNDKYYDTIEEAIIDFLAGVNNG